MANVQNKSDKRVADSSSNSMNHWAIEIPDELVDYESIANEWIEAISGKESIKSHTRERRMEKVPPLLLRSKNMSKRDYYKPVVVALGPYHHESKELLAGEKYKVTTLQLYVSSTGKSVNDFFNEVFKVIGKARKCYLEGSTDKYNDKELTKMMLLDGCFLLSFMETVAYQTNKLILNFEYLGTLGVTYIIRDIFLLENQLPYLVLDVLMRLKFDDGGSAMLSSFFNYWKFGGLFLGAKTMLPSKDVNQPLHLLELYRALFFLSVSAPDSDSGSCSIDRPLPHVKLDELIRHYNRHDDLNYMKENGPFIPSVRELKAKGIRFRAIHNESTTDIKFNSRCLYGQLELPTSVFVPSSKAIFMNLIAYEMCPHNPNDFRVTTYISFMKWLIVHPDDVKELRSKHILIHSLRADEEVVKMFEEIDTPYFNVYMINQVKQRIDKHCNSLTKTWLAELISLHFSSPWRTVALFGALFLLFLSFLQTYFTIFQPPDESIEKIISILQNSTIIK